MSTFLVHGRRSEATPLVALRRLVVGVLAGAVTGGFAAWAYYNDPYRPLSHTLGLWVLTVALLSARTDRCSAVAASCLTLVVAVLAFYVGKKVMYGIRYPGMPYSLSTDQLLEWGALAVVAGTILGALFATIGVTGQRGCIATAAAIGLLTADACRRATNYPDEGPVVIGFAALAIIAVLAVAVRTPQQLAKVAAWTIPAAAIGYALVSAPDLLEQLLYDVGV